MYTGSFLCFRTCRRTAPASIRFTSSYVSASTYRKHLPLGHLLFRTCASKRPLTLLSLLPIYTEILLMSAIQYTPDIPLWSSRTFSRVSSYHLFSTGISHLQNIVKIISNLSIIKHCVMPLTDKGMSGLDYTPRCTSVSYALGEELGFL